MLNATNSSPASGLSVPVARDMAAAERKAKRFWVGAIVALLGTQVIGGIGTIYLAVGDPSVAVIPNYYKAGLNWDVRQRSLDRFVQLGWQVIAEVQPVDSELNQRLITLHLRKGDQAVSKQRISAAIYHHARGNEIYKPNFDETQEGQYLAICQLTQSGLWQFDLSIEGDHGIAEARFKIDVAREGTTECSFPDTVKQAIGN